MDQFLSHWGSSDWEWIGESRVNVIEHGIDVDRVHTARGDLIVAIGRCVS
jgi:hypothetical protein